MECGDRHIPRQKAIPTVRWTSWFSEWNMPSEENDKHGFLFPYSSIMCPFFCTLAF